MNSECNPLQDQISDTDSHWRELLRQQPPQARPKRALPGLEDSLNPATQKLAVRLHQMRTEARNRATLKVAKMVARLAEDHDCHGIGVYLRVDQDHLTAVASYNIDHRSKKRLSIHENTIVSYVARSEVAYHVPDVQDDHEHHYYEDLPATRSEYCLPLFNDGVLLAVVNMESRRSAAFSKLCIERIENRVPELIPDLLILQNLLVEKAASVPWHPSLHGWTMSHIIDELCLEASAAIDPATVRFGLWEVDQQKDRLFVLGSYGHEWSCRTSATLKISESEMGRAIEGGIGTVKHLNVAKFQEARKAEILGITEASQILVNVPSDDPDSCNAVMTSISARQSAELDAVSENTLLLVEEALAELGPFMATIRADFQKLRTRVAQATLNAVQQQFADCHPYTQASQFLGFLLKAFAATAGSVFHFDVTENTLQCVATTGFRANAYLIQTSTFHNHIYQVEPESGSQTVAAFLLNGKALRRHAVGEAFDETLGPDVILKPSQQNAEFIAMEYTESLSAEKRKFLACTYFVNGARTGVVRLVRAQNEPPFTQADARLLELLCRDCRFTDTNYPRPVRTPAKNDDSQPSMEYTI